MEKAVKKGFKSSGKPLGPSGRKEMKKEVASRLRTRVEAQSSLVKIGQKVEEVIIDKPALEIGQTQLGESLKERINEVF